jgi:hypothetical protein
MEFTKYGQEFRVSAVYIATVLVLLTISTYKLHPAVILEYITVAQPAKKTLSAYRNQRYRPITVF